MTAETKIFPTVDVLSTITGSLMGEIGGVYKVLEWMSGEPVWTHQIPRVCREAVPVVLAMHPHLQTAIDEAENVTNDNYQDWLATWLDRYGPEISVPRMGAAQHERIDPVSELAESIHPDKVKVIVIKT